jgi:WD40 repeat protein
VLPPVGHLNTVTCVAPGPAGQAVASGGVDQVVRLWDLNHVQQRHAVGAGGVWGVGFHPDGKRIWFAGAACTTLPFIDIGTGQVQTPAYNNQHNGAIWSAAITTDGRYAVTGGHSDGTVRMNTAWP